MALIGTLVGRLRKEIEDFLFKEAELPFSGDCVQSKGPSQGCVEGLCLLCVAGGGRLRGCGIPGSLPEHRPDFTENPGTISQGSASLPSGEI